MYRKHLLLLLSFVGALSLAACAQGPESKSNPSNTTLAPPSSSTAGEKSPVVSPPAAPAIAPEARPEPTAFEATPTVLPDDPKPISRKDVAKPKPPAIVQAEKSYLIQGNKGGEKERILKSYFQYAEGRRALKSRKYDQAIQLFNKTIELNPNYADGFYYRGLAYLLTNQAELAERDYGVALRLSPKLATRSKFGDVIFEQAKVKIESNVAASQIAKLASFAKRFKTKQKLSDLSDLLFSRAVKSATRLDDASAMADFKIALDLDPSLKKRRGLAIVFDRRGFDLMKEDRFALAKLCFEKALAVNPDYQPAKIHMREVQSYVTQDVQGLPTNLKERISYLRAKPLTDRNYLRYMPILVEAYNEASQSKMSFNPNYPFKARPSKETASGPESNKVVINDKLLTIPLFQSISENLKPEKTTAWESDFRFLSDRFFKAAYRAAELNFARNDIFMAWEHVKGARHLCDSTQSKDTNSLLDQIIDRMLKLLKPEILKRYYSRFPTLESAIKKRKSAIKRKNAPKPKPVAAEPPPNNEYQLFLIIGGVIVLLLLVYIVTASRKGKNVKQFTKKMEDKAEKVDHLEAYEQWKTKGSQYKDGESEDA